jgi:ABC-type multidrug transport system permease subunit
VLKRLKATPLSAMEFLLAQVLSRLFIITIITIVVFVGCDIFIDFVVEGSYLLLLLIFLLGSLCMISLGLIMATRTVSEEFAGGLLNLISWPMMILSGVWFSMEGAPEPMQWVAQLLPLTHVVDASRAVMTDGAGLLDVTLQLLTLSVMTVIFLALGAYLFRWEN